VVSKGREARESGEGGGKRKGERERKGEMKKDDNRTM
jgi:hypothetical protein